MQNQNCLLKTELPIVLPISRIVNEAKCQKTAFVKSRLNVRPGQFFMLWIPGLDAKPYAVSYHEKNELGFTSMAIGKFSNAFDRLNVNDKIGLFGPYGNSFSIKSNSCVVAGGVGIASVSTLIDKLKKPIIINGARSKSHLLYLKRYKNKKMLVATDDGSYGRKCFTTTILEELLEDKKNKIKLVCTCGPEIMMKKVLGICNKYKVECEASLERMMKCSFGICGACTCNDMLVCKDGPIFNSKQLNKMSEFGKFARLKTGKKVTIEEYHSTPT
jgi:dihydroorotate dehydrogenase electron transfer subunit